MSGCAKYFSRAFMSGYTYLSSQEYDLSRMTKRPQHTILKLNQSITYHCTGQNRLQWLWGAIASQTTLGEIALGMKLQAKTAF